MNGSDIHVNELLGFVKEVMVLAEKVENGIPEHNLCADEKEFFFYTFLHRSVDYGKSLVALIEGQFTHSAVLVSRNVLEGYGFFAAYRKLDQSLAKTWCLYTIYEDYRKALERHDKVAADKLLADYKLKFGAAIVAEAQKEFVFNNRKENWYKKVGLISNIFEKLATAGGPDLIAAEQVKRWLYDPFSKVTHWTPDGVKGAEDFRLAAISVTFECLQWMSTEVNDEYGLGFGDDLIDVRKRFYDYSRVALAPLKI
jgi:hypothetical protein